MEVNIKKLQTITNYANFKNLSRQHVHRLLDRGEINCLVIDGVKFVYLDEKSVDFVKKRL